MTTDLQQRIETNPYILSGKPVIEGTRISVEVILEILSSGMEADELLTEYPSLDRDDVRAALDYAMRSVWREELYGANHTALATTVPRTSPQ